MKKTKIIAFALTMLLLVSLLPGVASAAYDTKTTSAVKGTPEMIDEAGNIDPIWEYANAFEARMLNHTWVDSFDTKTWGKFKTMWDENYLYILGEVSKDSIAAISTDLDKLDFAIDESNNKSEAGIGNVYPDGPATGVFQVYANDTPMSGFGELFPLISEKVQSKCVIHANGASYVMQIAIPWTTIVPMEGTVIGLDIQINESVPSEELASIIAWNSEECRAWLDTNAMGNLVLAAAPAMPEPEAPAQTQPEDQLETQAPPQEQSSPESAPAIPEPEAPAQTQAPPQAQPSPESGNTALFAIFALAAFAAIAFSALKRRRTR